MFDFLSYNSLDSYIPKQGPISFIRILNASPFSKRVDISIGRHPIAKGINFRKFTPYITVPSGCHTIKICSLSNKINPIYENLVLNQNLIYTAVITGPYASEFIVFNDPKIVNKDELANVRMVHLSYDTSEVDLEIPGTSIVFSQISYKNISTYKLISAGKYDLKIKSTNTNNPLFIMPKIEFKEKSNYTIFLIGLSGEKSGIHGLSLIDGNTYILDR